MRGASAGQRGDQTGTHLEEVHGVGALARRELRGAAGQRAGQRGAELGQVEGRAGRVDAQSGSVQPGRGARPLRGGRARLEAHRLDDVICGVSRDHRERSGCQRGLVAV